MPYRLHYFNYINDVRINYECAIVVSKAKIKSWFDERDQTVIKVLSESNSKQKELKV